MAELTPTGVVYETRNKDGEYNRVLIFAPPYGFRVLDGPAIHTEDPLLGRLESRALKQAVRAAVEALS